MELKQQFELVQDYAAIPYNGHSPAQQFLEELQDQKLCLFLFAPINNLHKLQVFLAFDDPMFLGVRFKEGEAVVLINKRNISYIEVIDPAQIEETDAYAAEKGYLGQDA